MSIADPTSQNDTPSIRDLLNILFEHIGTVLLVFLSVVATVGFLVFYLLSPKFEAQAIILVNSADIVRPIVDAPPKSDFEKLTDFHTHKDVLSSVTLIERVIDELNLAEERRISRIEQIRIELGDIKRTIGEWLGYEKWTRPRDETAAAIQYVSKNLQVLTSPESKAISIHFRAFDPDEAANVINTLIYEFEAYYYAQIQSEAMGVLSYLEQQIEQRRAGLENTELALLDFRQRDRIPTTDGALGLSADTHAFVGLTDSTRVQDEIKLYVLQLEEELRNMRLLYPDTSPRVLDVRTKLQRYVSALNAVPGLELEYVRLKRDFDLNQDAFQLLNRNLEQARIIALSQANKIGLIQTIEKAKPNDTPVSPKRKLALLMSLVLGISLSIAWAFTIAFFEHVLRTPADIKRHLGLRNLGSLPRIG